MSGSSSSPAGPPFTAAIQHLSSPLQRIMPLGGHSPAGLQRLGIPLYTPAAALDDDDARVLDVTPLYAGECVRDIRRILPAEEIVRELATGCSEYSTA